MQNAICIVLYRRVALQRRRPRAGAWERGMTGKAGIWHMRKGGVKERRALTTGDIKRQRALEAGQKNLEFHLKLN